MPEKSIVGGGGRGGRMYEVGGGVYVCGVCICVLYVGGGGSACVRVTKCGIGGWASGWKGRQTDRDRERQTHRKRECERGI